MHVETARSAGDRDSTPAAALTKWDPYYAILSISVLSVASAGALLKRIKIASAINKTFWRLFSTSSILLPGFCYEAYYYLYLGNDPAFEAKRATAEDRWGKQEMKDRSDDENKVESCNGSANERFKNDDDGQDAFAGVRGEKSQAARNQTVSFWDRYWSWETWGWMSLAGLSYAVHFITWIWSLDLTSLAHSLLFVTLTPMLFVIWKVICCKSIHLYEVVGCVIGMLGLGLMVADYAIEGEERVDYRGDMLAFVGAVAAVGFMVVASKLRKFIPLHLYAFPSTFMSTLPVLVTTVAVDGTVANTVESNSLWGFFSSEYLLLTALIALGPGYFGHTGSALVMKRLSPLSVSLAWTCEPLFGYLMGLLLGVASKASVFTFIGGPLNMLGVVLALYGGHLRGEEQRLIRLREAEKRTQYELQVAAPPSIIECTAAAPRITSSL